MRNVAASGPVLLDDVVAAVTQGYRGRAGQRRLEVARRSIPLTAAAKYFWLAPCMLTVAAPGGGHNDLRDEAAMFAGRRRLFELLTEWALAALD